MPIKRCKKVSCRKAFVAKGNQAYCSEEHANEAYLATKRRSYYKKHPVAEAERPPCWDCDFLNDCRHNVAKGRDPYCFVSNPRHGLFVERYKGGKYGGALTMIARTVDGYVAEVGA